MISHNDATLYRKFIDAVAQINPAVKVIGFTGTPFRSDSGQLCEGDGKLFDGIAYEIGIKYMIDNGYLCRPVVPAVETHMNTDGVPSSKGDFVAGKLEAAVNIPEVTKNCVREMLQYKDSRKKWLVFTAGVQHCTDVLEAIRLAGITAEMVLGNAAG